MMVLLIESTGRSCKVRVQRRKRWGGGREGGVCGGGGGCRHNVYTHFSHTVGAHVPVLLVLRDQDASRLVLCAHELALSLSMYIHTHTHTCAFCVCVCVCVCVCALLYTHPRPRETGAPRISSLPLEKKTGVIHTQIVH